MKALKRKLISSLSVVMLALLVVSQYSCTDNTIESQVDDTGVPELQGIRYVSPDSSRNIDKVGPGEMVVLLGKNLDSSTRVFFDGVQASFNPTLMTDTTLIVTVPDIPFGDIDPNSEVVNTIKAANDRGESVMDFTVAPPKPMVNSLSNEFAHGGETMTIRGQYLYLVQSIVFPGNVEVTDFETTSSGTSITLTVPQGVTESGGVEITTPGGSVNSAPAAPFHEMEGMVCNFDDVDHYAYWSATIESGGFADGWGNYAHMMAEDVAGGDWSWWNSGRSVNIDSVEWVNPANLGDPVGNYALKFEINVNVAMEYGTILIRNEDSWKYIARFEPWTDSGNAYKPDGWVTVTMPLTEFKTKSADGVDGAGDPAPSLTALLDDDGGQPLGFMYVNDDEDVTQTLDLAIDNIRIVRIAE